MTKLDAHSSPPRGHYDSLSPVYDRVTELFYGHARRVASNTCSCDPGASCSTWPAVPDSTSRRSCSE